MEDICLLKENKGRSKLANGGWRSQHNTSRWTTLRFFGVDAKKSHLCNTNTPICSIVFIPTLRFVSLPVLWLFPMGGSVMDFFHLAQRPCHHLVCWVFYTVVRRTTKNIIQNQDRFRVILPLIIWTNMTTFT